MTPRQPSPRPTPRRRRTVARRVLTAYAALLVLFGATLIWCLLELRAASREARLLREGFVPLQLELGEVLAQQNVFNAQLNHITAAIVTNAAIEPASSA